MDATGSDRSASETQSALSPPGAQRMETTIPTATRTPLTVPGNASADSRPAATSKSIPALVLLAACLSGCAPTLAPSSFDGGTLQLRPEIFFAGATSSSGVLENRSGAPTRRLHVKGTGLAQPDGSFRLEQSITFDQDAPRTRTWVMRRVDSHHYTGTLTDASGAVEAEAYGDLFHLRYPMKNPFGGHMEQWMYLQPDGYTVVNQATIRVFGIVVAHLSERITHEDR